MIERYIYNLKIRAQDILTVTGLVPASGDRSLPKGASRTEMTSQNVLLLPASLSLTKFQPQYDEREVPS